MPANPGMPDGFASWKRSVEQRLRDLATKALSRPALDKIEGAAVVISKGGSLRVENDAGTTLLYIGNLDNDHPDGTPQYGVIAYREDGSAAFGVYDSDPAVDGTDQFVAMLDRANVPIVADDTIGGRGLALPTIPLIFGVSNLDSLWSTDSSSYLTVAESFSIWQQPRGTVYVKHTTSDVSTTGHVRLLANGSVVGSPVASGFGYAYTVYQFDMPGAWGSQVDLELQAKVDSGTGRTFASVVGAFGTGN